MPDYLIAKTLIICFLCFFLLQTPGKLKQFLQDLYSGKLHREFHYGPDSTTSDAPEADSNDPANNEVYKVVNDVN